MEATNSAPIEEEKPTQLTQGKGPTDALEGKKVDPSVSAKEIIALDVYRLREEPSKLEGRAACDDPLCFGDCHPIRNRRPSPSSLPAMKELRALVNEQAEDEGLWFKAMYAPEAYLQQALRLVHDRAEKLLAHIEGKGD